MSEDKALRNPMGEERRLPLLVDFDSKRIVGWVQLKTKEFDTLLANGQVRLEVGGIALEMHMEGDVRVFDKFEVHEVSVVAVPTAKQPDSPPPIDMIIYCPSCGTQHVDRPDPPQWLNPPHKSHLCLACGDIFRVADVPTNGVVYIRTRGKRDTLFFDELSYIER